MALKSVLILTAGFGEGHNAAARNIAAALRRRNPSAVIEVHDVFAEAYGPLNSMVRDAYLLAISHAPALWRVMFAILDSTSLTSGGIAIFRRAARHLEQLFDALKPDAVVSTYPGYGLLLDHMRASGRNRRTALATMITDSLSINSAWYRPHSDALMVANEATADVLVQSGVDRTRIHVTGFPLPAIFDEPSARHDGPPWRVLYMVNSAHHLALGFVKALALVPGIELTVTAGRDAGLERHLREFAAAAPLPVEVHGWTPRISELIRRSHLLVSKAGGATVQEAIAAHTPMILTQVVPGQEEGNARLLTESGAAWVRETADGVAQETRRLFSEGAAAWLEAMQAMTRLSKPRAADHAAAIVESLVK